LDRRIVITGLGALTPAGVGVEALAHAIRDGRSAVRTPDHFDPAGYPSRVAGVVPEFDMADGVRKDQKRYLRKNAKVMARDIQMAVAAANQALLDSGHHDAELAEIVKASVDHGLHTRRLTWYPDAEETLLRLKDLGYRLGLICNTHWRFLPERRRELQPFFDAITLSYEHGYMKPHPSIFHATLMRLDVKPDKCLHVGDNPIADVWGAKKAGMKTVYIRRNELDTEADVVIQRLSELTRYLDK